MTYLKKQILMVKNYLSNLWFHKICFERVRLHMLHMKGNTWLTSTATSTTHWGTESWRSILSDSPPASRQRNLNNVRPPASLNMTGVWGGMLKYLLPLTIKVLCRLSSGGVEGLDEPKDTLISSVLVSIPFSGTGARKIKVQKQWWMSLVSLQSLTEHQLTRHP